jgi:hypothetical protein
MRFMAHLSQLLRNAGYSADGGKAGVDLDHGGAIAAPA